VLLLSVLLLLTCAVYVAVIALEVCQVPLPWKRRAVLAVVALAALAAAGLFALAWSY
jgi:hypothetical protein